MPPNRRQSPLALETIPALNLHVKAFPPLTSEVEPQQQHQQKKQVGGVVTIQATYTKDASSPTTNYWDWPSVTDEETEKAQVIDQIMKEEKARNLLSAAHVEANLIQASADAKAETVYASSVDEDYWFDANDEPATTDRPANAQSYWDWPSRTSQEEKQAIIDTIVEEERVRQLLTASHMVQNAVRHSASAAAPISNLSASTDKYWDWSIAQGNGYWSWPSTEADEKKLIIQNILNDERSRQQFSIQNIEACLLAESALEKPTQLVLGAGAESSYWDW